MEQTHLLSNVIQFFLFLSFQPLVTEMNVCLSSPDTLQNLCIEALTSDVEMTLKVGPFGDN